MGAMFIVVKVRKDLPPGGFRDPDWFRHPKGEVAHRISTDSDYMESGSSLTPECKTNQSDGLFWLTKNLH